MKTFSKLSKEEQAEVIIELKKTFKDITKLDKNNQPYSELTHNIDRVVSGWACSNCFCSNYNCLCNNEN